jgi:hypothetical protein
MKIRSLDQISDSFSDLSPDASMLRRSKGAMRKRHNSDFKLYV